MFTIGLASVPYAEWPATHTHSSSVGEDAKSLATRGQIRKVKVTRGRKVKPSLCLTKH
jgi:hypothetical protein